jgi:hypothetical protein
LGRNAERRLYALSITLHGKSGPFGEAYVGAVREPPLLQPGNVGVMFFFANVFV